MMQIWGRTNSINVQKALWTATELRIEFEQIDCGGAFGGLDTPEYRALNPNGLIPTLTDQAVVLWESNAICRYLVRQYGRDSGLYGDEPERASLIDRWLDWTLSTLNGAARDLFWQLVRTAPADRNPQLIESARASLQALWTQIDQHLDGRTYMETDGFTLADIALGCFVHRWYGLSGIERLPLPHLERWYALLQQRPAYQALIFKPLT